MDISIVAPVVMLLSFTTFFFQYLTLIREETEVFRDQSLSFYLVHDFCNILPSAAFDADCLSTDRSPVHCHVSLRSSFLPSS